MTVRSHRCIVPAANPPWKLPLACVIELHALPIIFRACVDPTNLNILHILQGVLSTCQASPGRVVCPLQTRPVLASCAGIPCPLVDQPRRRKQRRMAASWRSHVLDELQAYEDGPADVKACEQRDSHGFLVPVDAYEARRLAFESESRSAEAWRQAMRRKGAFAADLEKGKKADMASRRRIKALFRGGVPQVHRKWAWTHACNVADRLDDSGAALYAALWSRGTGSKDDESNQKQIEIDLKRTFPEQEYVSSGTGQAALRRVLLALSRHFPQIGYCQSLNYVAASLLVFLDGDENAAFWMATALIEQRLYPGTYQHDLIGLAVETKTAAAVLQWKAPKLARHLERCECDLSFFVTEWLLTIFSKSFPSETVARVWDTLIYEGSKILHRVILALLRSVEEEILHTSQAPDIAQIARRAARNFHDREKLLKAAFKKIGPFPRRILDRERKKALKKVTAEREYRAAVRRGDA